MDKNYRIVKTIESSGAGASSDMHEFKMTPYTDGTTVLMTVYQPRQYDLTTNPRFNIQNGMGWIVEGVFQEVDIETGNVLFEWRSLDHVDPGLSWTLPGTTDTSGDGLHEQTPWDYFHINSVDKNEDGDYLISARHVSAIYKLSGVDGSIMWEMGGNNPTFEQINFNFSYQHHARWVYENSTHTILSFYDNGSNTFNATGRFSHGWIVSIDHIANTATKVAQWGAPEKAGGLLSGSQGNMQLLPDGNCHIGWGEHAYFSEHTGDGTPVMYAKVADRASNVMIYRSNKYNWTAQPLTKPALWTYSRIGNRRSGMRFYVSWNGATEVATWILQQQQQEQPNEPSSNTSTTIKPKPKDTNPKTPWTELTRSPKNGFETPLFLPSSLTTNLTHLTSRNTTFRILAFSKTGNLLPNGITEPFNATEIIIPPPPPPPAEGNPLSDSKTGTSSSPDTHSPKPSTSVASPTRIFLGFSLLCLLILTFYELYRRYLCWRAGRRSGGAVRLRWPWWWGKRGKGGYRLVSSSSSSSSVTSSSEEGGSWSGRSVSGESSSSSSGSSGGSSWAGDV